MNYIDMYCNFASNVRGLAPSSVGHHRRYTTEFLKLAQKELEEVKINDVYEYFAHIRQATISKTSRYYYKGSEGSGKISATTVRGKAVIIRQFIEWGHSMGITTINPKLIILPKCDKVKLDALEDREMAILMRAPREVETRDDIAYRNTLLFMVGYYLGLRVSEACSLTFEQLEKDTIQIIGKRNKKRKLPVPFCVKDLALEYKKIRGGVDGVVSYTEEFTIKGQKRKRTRICQDKNPHLVFTCLDNVKYGEPLDPKGLGHIFRKYEKECGIKKRVTYHLFRHTFATHLLQSGVDAFTVKEMMGHRQISSTESYITISENQKQKAQMRIIREELIQIRPPLMDNL